MNQSARAAHRRVNSKENYVAMDGKWVDLYVIEIEIDGRKCYQEFAVGSNGRQITLNGYAWSEEFSDMMAELNGELA